MAKKINEISEISNKADLCDDPKEARLEINSGKYDADFARIMSIYFASEYHNNNSLGMKGSEIRKKFLEDFAFRESLIKFGKKKGIGTGNPNVWNAFTHQMNFEGESVKDIEIAYSKNIQTLFFAKEEQDTKVKAKVVEDPLLTLLSAEDKIKVQLSKKYGGAIQTFTKLSTILQFADSQEQENIVKFLVSPELKSNFPLDDILQLVDILDQKFYPKAISLIPYGPRHQTEWEALILSHILEKERGKKASLEFVEFILGKIERIVVWRLDLKREEQEKYKRLTDAFIEDFFNGLEILDEKIPEKTLSILIGGIFYVQSHITSIRIPSSIDFTIIRKKFAERFGNKHHQEYEFDRGLKQCIELQKKQKSKKKS